MASEDSPDPQDPQDSAWRSIIDNYGDRAEIKAGEFPIEEPIEIDAFDDDIDEPFEPEPYDDGAFVPPVPEKVTIPPVRLLAWYGVLGAPVAALLAVILVEATSWRVPSWLGWFIVAAFFGGFGYLVATMPRSRDDPYDDGARL